MGEGDSHAEGTSVGAFADVVVEELLGSATRQLGELGEEVATTYLYITSSS
jgi:hypothetical protein